MNVGMKTILIIGLGNPGKEYARTRHNAGFMFVDYFWEKFREEFGFSGWELKKKINAEISIGKANGKKLILLKPQTFMNLSGESVSAAVKYFIRGLTSNGLVVVHDEIDLPLGTFRASQSASSAGHKGAQNIIDQLGTKDFTRIRIGIGNKKDRKIATEKYVLGKLTSAELKIIKKTLNESVTELQKRIL